MPGLSEKYFPLIEKFKSLPGGSITVEQYCWQNSINIKTYYYWKKKYEAQCGKGFLAVAIESAINAGVKGIIIEYTDGTRLVFEQTVSPSFIKELLPAFRQ